MNLPRPPRRVECCCLCIGIDCAISEVRSSQEYRRTRAWYTQIASLFTKKAIVKVGGQDHTLPVELGGRYTSLLCAGSNDDQPWGGHFQGQP